LFPAPAVGRRFFIFALLLTPWSLTPPPPSISFPDGRRIVGAVEARAPIVVDGRARRYELSVSYPLAICQPPLRKGPVH
jgi:hypothetical protein